MLSSSNFVNPDVLATTEWLGAHLDDPDLVIVDCDMFDSYQRAHIKGAVGIKVHHYIKHPDYANDPKGHPLVAEPNVAKDIFESMDKDFVPSGTIVARLEEQEDRPWGTWSYGQPMTKHALARRLKNYGIAPSKKREGQHTVRGYYRDDNFKEKLKRYCQVDVEPTQMTQPSV